MLDILIGGVYTDTFQDKDNGGPECAKEMSLAFRMTVNLIAVSYIK
jgi:hypothetical protein